MCGDRCTHQLPAIAVISPLLPEGLLQVVDPQLQTKVLFLEFCQLLDEERVETLGMVQFPNGMCLAHQELRTSLTISWSFMVLVRWGDTRPALVRFLNVPVHDRIQQQSIRMNGFFDADVCVLVPAYLAAPAHWRWKK